jgi:hypothetical protein
VKVRTRVFTFVLGLVAVPTCVLLLALPSSCTKAVLVVAVGLTAYLTRWLMAWVCGPACAQYWLIEPPIGADFYARWLADPDEAAILEAEFDRRVRARAYQLLCLHVWREAVCELTLLLRKVRVGYRDFFQGSPLCRALGLWP